MHSDELQTLFFQKMSNKYDLAVHLFMVLLFIRSLNLFLCWIVIDNREKGCLTASYAGLSLTTAKKLKGGI